MVIPVLTMELLTWTEKTMVLIRMTGLMMTREARVRAKSLAKATSIRKGNKTMYIEDKTRAVKLSLIHI